MSGESSSSIPGGHRAPPELLGSQSQSRDKCTITSDIACTVPNEPGVRVEYRGKVEWDSDGDEAEGLMQVTIIEYGRTTCTGTYDVTYRRR